MVGSGQWEESLHDLVVEASQDVMNVYATPNIYSWFVFKSVPEPENKDEQLENAKQKWIKALKYIQSVAEKRGKKYIVGDEVCWVRFTKTK